MKLATFNVENMFERPKAMNLRSWDEGERILEDYAALNRLIQEESYTARIKAKLLEILERNGGLLTRRESDYLLLRDIRGSLFKKAGGKYEISAAGRRDWIGWFELKKEAVNEQAIFNTARVIRLVDAEVLGLVEVENRIALKQFNETILPSVDAGRYEHVMSIDGNDERGIDVGIMLKGGYRLERIVSHVDDRDETGLVFSRDCAEYLVATPGGERLLLLVNHFKSKGYGKPAESDAKRLRQAKRVREIVDERLAQGQDLVAVLGDFNDNPDRPPLAPLIAGKPALVDIMAHPKYAGDGRPGSYGNGSKSGKLDYILLSEALAERVSGGGIERRGVWGGVHGTLFPHLDTITRKEEAASDHAALWTELEL